MITEDLIIYIQTKRKENISDDEISSRLTNAGWHVNDIKEGFSKLNPPTADLNTSQTKPKNTIIDPYRELPESIDKPLTPLAPITPKVLNPSPVIEQDYSTASNIQSTTYKIEEPPTELVTPKIDSKSPSTFSPQSSAEIKPVFAREELIPTLTPKNEPVNKSTTLPTQLTNNAILTTLSRDILASENSIVEPPVTNKSKKMLVIIAIVLVASAICGIIFSMISGYISLPSFSLIKKDPKSVLLATPLTLQDLDSYTSETTVTVSLPSVAHITNGLISGDSINSTDTDSASITVIGLKNKNPNSSRVSDYKFNIQSSLLKNVINSDIKYDGTASFITIPSLHGLFGNNTPAPGIIQIHNNEFNDALSILPDTYADIIRNVDTNKIIQNGISQSIKSNLSLLFKDFITTATVTEKTAEDIHGVTNYHYQFTFDRPTTKKFLTSLFDIFTTTLSNNQKSNLEEALGATTVNNFEVWVGKNDDLVHQYKISLGVPLSKIINLDDKGIAGNQVTLDWQTAYYDFNIPHVISAPDNAITFSAFLKSITDQKIKNTISNITDLAKALHNAEGSYGNRANVSGSCTNPNPNSLFSPVGHTKGALTAVGGIATSMNTLLSLTNGAGSCFSSPTAWAVAAPLESDSALSYCVDSTGKSTILTTPLKGTICK